LHDHPCWPSPFPAWLKGFPFGSLLFGFHACPSPALLAKKMRSGKEDFLERKEEKRKAPVDFKLVAMNETTNQRNDSKMNVHSV
jgi:hypothetical protein